MPGAKLLAGMLFAAGSAMAAPVLNNTDFMATPTVGTGFENAPSDGQFYTGGSVYTTNGIKIQQIGGDGGNDIELTHSPLAGSASWFPRRGDLGYTSISMASGEAMLGISLLYASQWTYAWFLQFDVLREGVSLLSGFEAGASFSTIYRFGVEGGEFDEIRLRGINPSSGSFGDGLLNLLRIDAVNILLADTHEVPEPGSLALLGMALGCLAAVRRRRT